MPEKAENHKETTKQKDFTEMFVASYNYETLKHNLCYKYSLIPPERILPFLRDEFDRIKEINERHNAIYDEIQKFRKI